MPLKSNTENFIRKANERHGCDYGYSLAIYVNNQTPVKILCHRCNVIFEQKPCNHLAGRGCKPCGRKVANSKTSGDLDNFIHSANKKHTVGHYDYSLSIYTVSKNTLKIRCNIHDIIFEQTPNSHLRGNGCKLCGLKSTKNKLTKSFESFYSEAIKLRPNKFEYFEDDYVNKTTPTKIKCIKHNHIYKQTPKSHLIGSDCPLCEIENHPGHRPKSIQQFIIDATTIHGNKFNYTKSNYVNAFSKIIIICNICQREFVQAAYTHLLGRGCPHCLMSRGESAIRLYLDTNNIKYITQRIFTDCRSPKNRVLKFDFHLPSYNLLVEFDGKQHYELSNIRGYKTTVDELRITRQHDKLKDEYALKNNIDLLRIPYWEMKNIPIILGEKLKI